MISKCYDDERIQQLLDKAAFLDPRFKKCVSTNDNTIETIKEASDHFSPVEEELNRETLMQTKKTKGLRAVLNHIVNSLSPTESVKRQIKEYCDEPVMPTDTNALERWLVLQKV